MPTYDYTCKACRAEFEVFHGMTEQPRVECPACGSTSTSRLLTGGTGLIFKGSGFYITDYKGEVSKGGGTPASKDKTSDSPAVASEGKESKSDTAAPAATAKTETGSSGAASSSKSPASATPSAG